MTARKGIILAGGSGTRLHPITIGVSKQLLPVYDKPMVYYPLSVLMLAGIRQVAIITNPEYINQFKRLLKDGSQWGIEFTYIEQPSPDGLAQAYLLAEGFLNGAPSALVLGDNIFYGDNFSDLLKTADAKTSGGSIFGYRVTDPERYGVIGFDEHGHTNSIVEKPKTPRSNYAVTGLYFLDATASERAKSIKPSQRGELEITDVNKAYLESGELEVELLGRGAAWLDTGTHDNLLAASQFIQTIEQRQGLKIACPEEIAYRMGYIDEQQLRELAEPLRKSGYGEYLLNVIEQKLF